MITLALKLILPMRHCRKRKCRLGVGGGVKKVTAEVTLKLRQSTTNALSLPSGMVSYGQAVSSWNQYADANNLTPEQKQAGLDKIAKGELPEGANISKVIVDGYKDGVLIAGAWYLGPAASVGKVIGGGVIAEIANGTYQWFDLSQPGNENKNWDWKSSASAGITGMLAPGRTVGQNVGLRWAVHFLLMDRMQELLEVLPQVHGPVDYLGNMHLEL
ncbi:hypothetical protein JNE141411_47250 (plasmid) [Escherichia coli]|nr:hypothetical protein JNE141411_47250 [Escherichia coli]BDW71954.1 hypothetical protein JNE151685_46320 [Escherichia coli]